MNVANLPQFSKDVDFDLQMVELGYVPLWMKKPIMLTLNGNVQVIMGFLLLATADNQGPVQVNLSLIGPIIVEKRYALIRKDYDRTARFFSVAHSVQCIPKLLAGLESCNRAKHVYLYMCF